MNLLTLLLILGLACVLAIGGIVLYAALLASFPPTRKRADLIAAEQRGASQCDRAGHAVAAQIHRDNAQSLQRET